MDANTASVLVAGIAAIASTISIIVSTRAQSIAKATHTAVNSRMDEMLALTKSASFAEGVEQQRVAEAASHVGDPVPVTIVADEPVPVRETAPDRQ